ncbi:hypothetical protein CRI94_12220 [Longibacter salinarum]|uniref:Translocation and assembly module TamB C-terminal domain-containing protein n=1 Tax=Longibacter salinarum TaxID=1850348 RepID=A0A2A8CW10_9BACT|nr:translocation/assembly module TamB [Longibacter salinarum]PEN12777.1 hypothetical protein CRI94_12220 [Longibacter salinarum]
MSTPPSDASDGSPSNDASPKHDAHNAEHDAPQSSKSGTNRRTWTRRIERGLAYTFATITIIAFGVLLALQVNPISTATARYLASTFNPLEGTTLSIDRVDGTWLTSLELTGVRLTRTDSTTGESVEMARIDTVRASYRLSDLLNKTLHVTNARVAGPDVTLRQAADSTWDWVDVLPTSTDTTTSDFVVRVDDATLARGKATARFYAEGRDSVAAVRDLYVDLPHLTSDATLGGLGVRAELDTLGLRATVPGDTSDVTFGTKLRLDPTALRLDTLTLSSSRSEVKGHGFARLPSGPSGQLEDVDLEILAQPLSFLDLVPLLPAANLDASEEVTAALRLSGSGDLLHTQLIADFRDGGAIDVDASFTPRTSPTSDTTKRQSALRYDVQADIDRLTTSLIGLPDTTVNRITSRIRADLEGPAVDRLTGPVSLIIANTRVAETRIDSFAVDAMLRDGTTNFDVRGTVNETGLDGSGRAELFRETPTYRLSAQLTNLDATRFGVQDFPTDVNGKIDIDGSGFSTYDLQAAVDLSLERSRLRDLTLSSGNARLSLSPDSVAGRVGLQTADGSVQVSGKAYLDGSERFRIDTARVKNLNVAALMADTTDSRFHVSMTANGRGFDPTEMRLDGRLTVEESHYGTIRIDSLSSRVGVENGRLSANLATSLNEGRISLTASGRPFDDTITLGIDEGRFEAIDIGEWMADSGYSSDLNGTFEGSLRGTEPQRLQASADVRIDTSQINRAEVSEARINTTMENGVANVAASLTLPEGTTNLGLTLRPFADEPEIVITDGRIQGLDVGALAGIDGLRTGLNGDLSGQVRGTALEEVAGQLNLQIASSYVNNADVQTLDLSVDADSGRAQLQVQSQLAGGSLQADGRLAFDGTTRDEVQSDAATDSTALDLNVRAETLNLAALAGTDSLEASLESLRLTFDGAGTSLSDLRAETDLAARGVRAADLNVRTLDVRGALRDGRLRVDTLLARSNAFDANGGGTVAFVDTVGARSDFRFTAQFQNLSPLRRIMGSERLDAQSAEIDGRIYGAPGALQANVEARLESLVYDDIRIANAEFRAAGAQGDTTAVDNFELAGQVDFFSVSAFRVERTQLRVDYDSSFADVELQAKIDNERNLSIDATLDPFSEPQRLQLNEFNATLGESKWQLLQEASITYGDAYRVNGLLLFSDNQQIAADGRIDPNGTQSLVATIERFDVASIADLAGYTGLGGTLNGTVSLSGPATAPVLDGNLDMALNSGGEDVGDLVMSLSYDSLRIETDATLTHTSGEEFTANGHLPVDLRLDSTDPVDISDDDVDLAFSATDFPIDWIDPFLDPALVTDPSGTLTADLGVDGTVATPELTGSASLNDGRISVTDLDLRYRDASAQLNFEGEDIVLESASVSDDSGGRMEATGRINLTDLTLGQYDLDVTANDFTAIDTRAFNEVRIDGNLDVTGTTDSPVVNGRVTVIQGDIYYSETLSAAETADLATVQLNEDDQRLLERRFGVRLSQADTTTIDTYAAMAMDLNVSIRRDTWLRSRANPELNIQFTGTLDLQKEPFEDARVFGSIDVVPERSTVRQFGQEFQIQEGVLTFNGDPAEPYLDFTAVYEKKSRATNSTEVQITLSAQGRPEDLDLRLSSQPQMDTRNILAYLATGQPADQLFGGGGGSTGDFAENLAIGQLTSLAENFATSNVGLDVVRIQYQPSGGSYFVLGRYVTPRFYVAIEQPVTVDQNQGQNTSSLAPDLTLEYELTDNLLLRAQSRQQSLRFNVLFEYAY